MSDLTFRLATTADVHPTVALVTAAYRGEASTAGWTSEDHLLKGQRTDAAMVTAAVTEPDGRVVLAERDGELLGCIQVTRAGGAAHAGMFAVDPTLQARGIGSALLTHAEDLARGPWGCTSMDLEVIAQRDLLISYYVRRGYRLTGETKSFPYGDERFGIPQRDDLRFVVLRRDLRATSDRPVDLCFAGAREQANLIRNGHISARELVDATLERIEILNPRLNAYRAVFADQARAEADRVDLSVAERRDQLLLGVPVAVKDTVDVAGEVTTWGTAAKVTAAREDAPIVASLRAAGAIIIGKTTSSELAAWPFTETPAWGATRNPWSTDYSPGGSSGGSAVAVAAGLCGIALGSDGLGSIRAPSSFTGVFGVKPQRGRVWHGREDWNGLAVNGPIARHVADAALFLDATAMRAPAEPFSATLARLPTLLRIAVAWKPLAKFPLSARLGDEQREAVHGTVDLLTGLGHTVVQRELEFSRHASSNIVIRYLTGVAQSVALLEKPDQLSDRTRTIAKYGRRVSARQLRTAMKNEAAIADAMNQIFEDVDVVLTPGATQPPLRIGQLDNSGAVRACIAAGRMIPHFGPWNVIGQPAVSVPAGFSSAGLPLSVQLAGRVDDEPTLLSLASQLETARPWATHRPPLD